MTDFTPAVLRILRENGFEFWRHGRGDHNIWRHAATRLTVSVDGKIKSRHSANETLKQAGLRKAF